MVIFLLRQQGKYTKHPCSVCYWDRNEPLVNRDRIILPLLHVKLGLMKQFVKALDKDGDYFNYIAKTYPGLSMVELEASIFDRPHIHKLMQD